MQAVIQVKIEAKEIRDLVIEWAQGQCNLKGGGSQCHFEVGEDGALQGATVSFQYQTKK